MERITPLRLVGDLRRGGLLLTGRLEADTDLIEHGQSLELLGRSGALYLDSDWWGGFAGYCLAPDVFEFSRYGSLVNFAAGSLNELLGLKFNDAFGFAEVITSGSPHEIDAPMTAGAIFETVLTEHTNLIYDAVSNPGGVVTETDINRAASVRLPVYNLYAGQSLWSALSDLAGGELGGAGHHCWFDRLGGLHFQPVPAFASPALSPVLDLDRHYLRGKVEVRLNNLRSPVGQVALTAGAGYDLVYLSRFPALAGEGELYHSARKFLAYSQDDADLFASRCYAWLTRPYTLRVEVDPGLILHPEAPGLDLSQAVTLTYDGAAHDLETGAGVALSLAEHRFFIYGYEVDFVASRGWLTLESDVND